MELLCPISGKKIDERVVRVVAFLVLITITSACFTKYFSFIALALTVDFFGRAFTNSKVSVLASIARFFVSKLKLPSKPIDAGPKIFAARIGFFVTLIIAVFGFMEMTVVARVIVLVLAVCAFLEAFCSICAGCFLYSFFKSIKFIKG